MYGVLHAPLFHGRAFGFRPIEQDRLSASGVDISGREVFQTLVIAPMVVVTDEGRDLVLQTARQEVVL